MNQGLTAWELEELKREKARNWVDDTYFPEEIESMFVVQDHDEDGTCIYLDFFTNKEDAIGYADSLEKSNVVHKCNTKVEILYVERTEEYYLRSDLEDENFNWEGWHSADDVSWTSLWKEEAMKRNKKSISIDNGLTFVEPEVAISKMRWEIIAHSMEDEAREQVHGELAPCLEVEFLHRYLEVAKHDLIIG